MNPLELPATDTTPKVVFNPAGPVLRFEGESYPENVSSFFGPVHAWLKEYLATGPNFRVELAFTYLNTSSTKAVLDLLLALEEFHRAGGKVSVTWFYQPGIEVMQEAGEEFGLDLTLPYQLSVWN